MKSSLHSPSILFFPQGATSPGGSGPRYYRDFTISLV